MVPIHNLSSDANALRAERWLHQALDHIPEKYLVGLSGIYLKDEPEGRGERRQSKRFHRQGHYDLGKKEIFLFVKSLNEYRRGYAIEFFVLFVFLHELGHHCDLWLQRTHARSKPKKEAAAVDWGKRLYLIYIGQKHHKVRSLMRKLNDAPRPIRRLLFDPIGFLILRWVLNRERIPYVLYLEAIRAQTKKQK